MNPKAIRDRLAMQLAISPDWQEGPGDPFAVVPPGKWREACRLLRDDPELSFDFLRSLTAVDRPAANHLEIVVHLFSYKHRHAFVLKTKLDRAAPALDTLCGVWPAANWHERELFDLFGIQVNGHPDLRRLLLPEEWVGFPLRKDYQEQPDYQGIPTQRPTE